MQKNRSLEIMVGFFIVLGFAAALFMALQAANLGSFSFGHKTYAVTADFDNIGGLKARAAVMDMDAQYPFPDDSSAKILTSGLLGEQYVGIEAGADDKNLEEGSVIRRTQSAVVLENLISQFLYSKAEDGGK